MRKLLRTALDNAGQMFDIGRNGKAYRILKEAVENYLRETESIPVDAPVKHDLGDIYLVRGCGLIKITQGDSIKYNLIKMENAMLEQLKQLRTATWDGNLISKQHRDELIKAELAEKKDGWNFLTAKGIKYLIDLGQLKP